MHVIIQAGGKGTRLEGLTRNRPKCLVPIRNRPIIFWAFEAYKGHDLKVICDYKEDVLKRYLQAFGSGFKAEVINARGTGTASGIRYALENVEDDEPVVIIWCDLFFEKEYKIPAFLQNASTLDNNYVGLSNTFKCRWSFEEGVFKHTASSSTGVAGFFVFKNKEELSQIPIDGGGGLVPWLASSNKTFTPFYLENITEVGTITAFEEKSGFAICRPFNEVKLNDETVTKRGVDAQGKKIAIDEIAWYKHVSELQFSAIPKIHSYDPLILERIKGKNIWEYDCLTISEKQSVISKVISHLNALHELEPTVQANTSDLHENYIEKTFQRLSKVEDLVPFARNEYIKINGRYYKNIFYNRNALQKVLENYYPKEFHLIHGDPTFSNMIYDRVHHDVFLIDPRGYFGKTKFYGDVDYDWAKVYYSLVGNYDQFNRKKFSLTISDKDIELAIRPNNWSDMEDFFFDSLDGVSRTKIRAIHAVIWLSLTTYAWEDYDSICGAFYKGIVESAEFL